MVLTVADLSEDEILARLTPLFPPPHGPVANGDDAAVVSTPDGTVVACTDVLVQGRHFRTDWSSGADVGWRAVMQNLSDISAMGARPTAILIDLVLPGELPFAWVEDCARGIANACQIGSLIWGAPVGVAGGDLSGGDAVVLAITALGDMAGASARGRSGAQAGDVVAVIGQVGWSAAGLALAEAGYAAATDAGTGARPLPAIARQALTRFRRPAPPLRYGRQCLQVNALMDISDGVVRDAERMARASGMHIDLDAAAIAALCAQSPLLEVARLLEPRAMPADLQGVVRRWIMGGGEDHGLLLTCPAEKLPAGAQVIGKVDDGAACLTLGREPIGGQGWDHFRRG